MSCGFVLHIKPYDQECVKKKSHTFLRIIFTICNAKLERLY